MTKFTKSFSTIGRRAIVNTVALAVLATIGFGANIANAQSVTLPGVTTVPSGVSMNGWNASEIKAWGHTVGGDGKGTVQTIADGVFTTKINANLATNSQGSCKIDCQYTLSHVNMTGELIAGSRVTNQGFGTQANPVMSVANTGSNFMSSATINWAPTAVPASPQPAPGPAKP